MEEIEYKTKGSISAIALSPDRQFVVAGLANGKLYCWQLRDLGLQQAPFYREAISKEGDIKIISLKFSPNGKWLAIGTNKGVYITAQYNQPGEHSFQFMSNKKSGIEVIKFSPNENYIAWLEEPDEQRLRGFKIQEINNNWSKNIDFQDAQIRLSDFEIDDDGKAIFCQKKILMKNRVSLTKKSWDGENTQLIAEDLRPSLVACNNQFSAWVDEDNSEILNILPSRNSYLAQNIFLPLMDNIVLAALLKTYFVYYIDDDRDDSNLFMWEIFPDILDVIIKFPPQIQQLLLLKSALKVFL